MENNNLQKHLKVLSVDIGPRGSTSLNEKKAAEYISSVFTENNIPNKTEIFSSLYTFTWTYFLIYFLFIISFILFFINNLISFFIALCSLLFFIAEIYSFETISKILPKRKSQNVIGEIKSLKENAKDVLLVAHYDSSRAGSAFAPKVVKNFHKLFILGFLSQGVIVLIYFLSLFFPKIKIVFIIATLPSILLIVITIILLLHREFFYPLVAGANDNASGVATLLSLSSYLSKNKFPNLNITFLATGAEEAGIVGMLDYLKKYKDKVKKSWIINFDGLGGSELKYTIGEGMIKVFYTPSDFLRIVEKIKGLPISPYIYRTAFTDATACLVRGYRAISIMTFDKNNIIPNWHWMTDTYENVDLKNLKLAKNFTLNILEEINNT